MGQQKTVTLEPDSNQEHVTQHKLQDVESGDTIKFMAVGSRFGVDIYDASNLFQGVFTDNWNCSIQAGKYEITPAIKDGVGAGSEWKYSVYCEETKDYAKDSNDSPPLIIIKIN